MADSGSDRRVVPRSGWDARLYGLWILRNTVAFVTVLTAGFLLALLGSNVLHLSLARGRTVVALLIATSGAVLFGGVLGSLQWRPASPWRRDRCWACRSRWCCVPSPAAGRGGSARTSPPG